MRVGRILGESNGILTLLSPRCVAFTRTTMRMPTRSTAPRAPREGKAVARRCVAVRCGSSDHVLSRCVLVLMSSYVQWPRLRSPHCLERWQSTRLHERPPGEDFALVLTRLRFQASLSTQLRTTRTHDRERRPIGRNLEVQTSECGPILTENRSTTLLAVRPAARRELKA